MQYYVYGNVPRQRALRWQPVAQFAPLPMKRDIGMLKRLLVPDADDLARRRAERRCDVLEPGLGRDMVQGSARLRVHDLGFERVVLQEFELCRVASLIPTFGL